MPAIVKWPGRICASVSDQPAITFDWSASILAAAGVPVPASYEGINIFPTSRARAEAGADVLLALSAQLQPDAAGGTSGRLEARLTRTTWLLYNLREDIGERHDHTMQKPDIVRRLRTLVDDWARSVDADAKAAQ